MSKTRALYKHSTELKLISQEVNLVLCEFYLVITGLTFKCLIISVKFTIMDISFSFFVLMGPTKNN